MPEVSGISVILAELREGNEEALRRLVPIVYAELRRLANYYLSRERKGHTLQATALVHEVYLRLAGSQHLDVRDRSHFFAVAAQVMRNILVDRARTRRRVKRGSGQVLSLEAAAEIGEEQSDDVLAVDEALEDLARLDPRQARIVELRYFGGLSVEEIAAVLDVSERTVKRDWQMAKAWLCDRVRGT